jgi:2-(1,2-epoxy-1,2-dihydrophenyl)acetyl-CoA isomerase
MYQPKEHYLEKKDMKKWLTDFFISGVSIELEGGVLVIRYGESIFNIFSDLDARDRYITLLDAVDNDSDVKAVLSLNDHGCLGEEPYEKYVNTLCEENKPVDLETSWEFQENIEHARQLCFHYYTATKRLASKKLIIDGLQGTVVTPFFGESLSADIRLVSDDFCYSLAHKKYGIHPTGGLAFFLPRFVGQGRANEILLTTDVIDAKSALNLGLVSQIFPKDNFESSCIQIAKELAELSPATIETTKRLSFNYEKALEDYFYHEIEWKHW